MGNKLLNNRHRASHKKTEATLLSVPLTFPSEIIMDKNNEVCTKFSDTTWMFKGVQMIKKLHFFSEIKTWNLQKEQLFLAPFVLGDKESSK